MTITMLPATYEGGDFLDIPLTGEEFQVAIDTEAAMLHFQLPLGQFLKFAAKFGSGDRISVQAKDGAMWIVEINDLGDCEFDGDTTVYVDVI